MVAVTAPLVPWLVGRAADPEAFGGLCVQLAALVVGVVAFVSVREGAGPVARSSPASLIVGALLLLVGLAGGVRIVQMTGALCLAHAAVVVVAPARASVLVPALWLAILGLPLTGDLDVVGFPARLFAARVAHTTLSLLGLQVGGAETVLVVEGNVADVEAPCAGLQTLRMLAAVVVVVGALRKSGLDRIALALVCSGVVAVVGNALRVTALAALVLGAHRDDFARLVHVPLGVVVFGAAVFVADLVLRWPSRQPSKQPSRRPARAPDPRARTIAAVAGLVVVAVIASIARFAPATAPASGRTSGPTSGTQSGPAPLAALSTTPSADAVPLTPSEQALFGRHALFAEKRRTPWGSVLVVVATSLRAHHAPERCLAGSGFRVDASTTITAGGVLVKRLVLDGGARIGLSFYVRDDGGQPRVQASLLERAADQLVHRAGPWAFVSAVVDADARSDVDALVPMLLQQAHARLLPVTQDPR